MKPEYSLPLFNGQSMTTKQAHDAEIQRCIDALWRAVGIAGGGEDIIATVMAALASLELMAYETVVGFDLVPGQQAYNIPFDPGVQSVVVTVNGLTQERDVDFAVERSGSTARVRFMQTIEESPVAARATVRVSMPKTINTIISRSSNPILTFENLDNAVSNEEQAGGIIFKTNDDSNPNREMAALRLRGSGALGFVHMDFETTGSDGVQMRRVRIESSGKVNFYNSAGVIASSFNPATGHWDGKYAPDFPTSFADFANYTYLRNGAIVPFGDIYFARDTIANIPGLGPGAGWKPHGDVYPEHFGARAVSGFDSAPGFQAAINYCKGDTASQHRGRYVLNLNPTDGYRLQKGLFIDRPISIRSNAAMQSRLIFDESFAKRDGAPAEEAVAGLVVAAAWEGFDYATEAAINGVIQLENLDMRFNGNFTSPPDGIRRSGILVKAAPANAVRSNLRMSQVSVRTFSHHGLWGLNGGAAVQADNCRFHDNYGAGVRIDSRADWFFFRCMFAGTRDATTACVDLNGAGEIQFSQCDVYNSAGFGIRQYNSNFRFVDGMVDRNQLGGYRHRSIAAKDEVVFVGTKFGLNSRLLVPTNPDILIPSDAVSRTLKLLGVGFYPITAANDSSLVNVKFEGAATGVIAEGCSFAGEAIPTIANKGTTHEGRVFTGLTTDNILGTMGALGDAIIELGANYVRFEGGLQICWGQVSLTPTVVGTGSPVSTTVTFGKPFIAAPFVQTTPRSASPGTVFAGFSNETTTNVQLFLVRLNDLLATLVHWKAIGKWK